MIIDLNEDEYSGNAPDIGAYEHGLITEIAEEETLPDNLILYQNYPNPFNPATTIKYQIPNHKYQINSKSQNSKFENPLLGGDERGGLLPVTLVVFDVLGREVATLVNEPQRPGIYEVIFNASSLSSGVYFYKLTAGNYISTKKLMLMK